MENTTKTETDCICGNCASDIIAVRAARGLAPFCRLRAAKVNRLHTSMSYLECVGLVGPGEKIVRVPFVVGSPRRRFMLVSA